MTENGTASPAAAQALDGFGKSLRGHQQQWRRRRIVGRQRAGDARRAVVALVTDDLRQYADDHPDLFGGDAAGAQQTRRQACGGCQVENRRLDPHRAAPAIEDQADGVAEFVAHMRGFGRADPAEAIRRWSGDAGHAVDPATGPCIGPQQGQRQRVCGNAQADAVLPAGDGRRYGRRAFENQGQRAGPECLGQFPGHCRDLASPAVEIAISRQMHDQRMIGGPPLGGEDSADGCRVGRVCPEAIDCLGRKGDQFAGLQQRDGAIDLVDIRRHRRFRSWRAPPSPVRGPVPDRHRAP